MAGSSAPRSSGHRRPGSRWEQETARRALRRSGLLEERRVGMPGEALVPSRADAVWRALQAHAGAADR